VRPRRDLRARAAAWIEQPLPCNTCAAAR
jgi:hypothetical protein